MPGSPQTVHDLLHQWKPHKERLATVRSEQPIAIRFHRTCRWLSEVEQLDPVPPSADQILLHQWIAKGDTTFCLSYRRRRSMSEFRISRLQPTPHLPPA